MGGIFSNQSKIEVDEKYRNLDISEASHPYGFDKKYRNEVRNSTPQIDSNVRCVNISSESDILIRVGRPKRRRLTRNSVDLEISDGNENNVDSFRRDVLRSFNGSNMNITLNYYFTSVDRSNRSKKVKDEIVYCFEFHYMTPLQRFLEIMSFSEDHQNLVLSHLLGQLKEEVLRNIFNTHFPVLGKKEAIKKGIIIQQILTRFFCRSKEFESRIEEAKNISSVNNSNSFKFLIMCGTLIPLDVILHILSFLEYDSGLLLDTGRVCKSLYLSILRSWPRVRINKSNIYQISLLVLKSVKSVSIDVVDPTQNLQNYDVEYIFSNLNPDRLQRLEINSNLGFYIQFLRSVCSSEKKTQFPYVRSLKYVHCKGKREKEKKAFRCDSWGRITISAVFPNLREFIRPVHLYMLSFLDVRKVLLDFSIRRKYSGYRWVPPLIEFNEVKESVEELELQVEHDDFHGINTIPELLFGFSNLKTLRVSVICGHKSRRCLGVQVLRLLQSKNVSKIILHNDISSIISGRRVFHFPRQNPEEDDDEKKEKPSLRDLEFTQKLEKHGLSFEEAGWALKLGHLTGLKFTSFFRSLMEFETFLANMERNYDKFENLQLNFLVTPFRVPIFGPFHLPPYPTSKHHQCLSLYQKRESKAVWVEMKNSLVQHRNVEVRNNTYVKKLVESLSNMLNGQVRKKKWVVFYHHDLPSGLIISSANLAYLNNSRHVVNTFVKEKMKDAGYELVRIVDERIFYYVCEETLET